ncbi:DsbA family protein [Bermanella sp. WJH001]|uniref:DsbA family protein n=1 Tax=Bermanella sp. WJH001 TaxID=3048005 RepID=UPI0024BD7712|nr:DsbA family protein [Bermanella sp. WJH001]MDJ1537383.1 DsbA family protein [Bermanella sp. WJH001]
MRSLITPFVSGYWSSDNYLAKKNKQAEDKLCKQKRPRYCEVFVALDDPYSYLLLQLLRQFCEDFSLDLDIHLIHRRQADMFPENTMWSKWAIDDATKLAGLYQLYLPPYYPKTNNLRQAQSFWAQHPPENIHQAIEHFEQLWLDRIIPSANTCPQPLLRQNEQHLQALGHYLPASIYFAGQWYWGIDRLEHLEQRLLALGFNEQPYHGSKYARTWENFCAQPTTAVTDKTQPIELFFSMRSPYSHLALNRCHALAKHYQVPLIIKPVLPMLMRNLSVPKNKTRYIFFDAVREGQKLNIPYGKVADPLGKGVENTYALWHWAKQQDKGTELLLAISHFVNVEGISANFHSGLKKICQKVGLDWQDAKLALKSDEWHKDVNDNIKELYTLGLWGVPSMRYKHTHVWGQDRIWCIEAAMLTSK